MSAAKVEEISVSGGLNRKWIALSVLLAVVTFGVGGILKLTLFLLVVLAGILVVFYALATSGSGSGKGMFDETRQTWSIPRTKPSRRPEAVRTSSKQFTGIPEIDAELRQIVNFVFRDYIHSWNSQLTHTNDFVQQTEESLHAVIATLSGKIRKVDWIPFLTTRFVYDVANHVKLFKKATATVKDGGAPDLESAFFDAELAAEESTSASVCRDLVSTVLEDEIRYLQDVADIVLFLLLPKDDFAAQGLRTLTRELLVHIVLKPVLDMFSDPDFINQNIVWLYRDYPIKPDLFVLTLRYSECVEELEETRECALREIDVIRSKDSLAGSDATLKQQLDSLIYLKKLLDDRITRLKKGSETDSIIGLPGQVDWNQMVPPTLRLFVLPLDVILKNSVALGYFIEFMSSINAQSYVFFYLNIEGWKVSTEMQLQSLLDKQKAEGKSKSNSFH